MQFYTLPASVFILFFLFIVSILLLLCFAFVLNRINTDTGLQITCICVYPVHRVHPVSIYLVNANHDSLYYCSVATATLFL